MNEGHTVPKTSKNRLGNSLPICIVLAVNTPNGNVNPHHPMLNGNRQREMLMMARNSHTSANPHMIVATSQPSTYKISPGLLVDVGVDRMNVEGKTVMATFPSCIIP